MKPAPYKETWWIIKGPHAFFPSTLRLEKDGAWMSFLAGTQLSAQTYREKGYRAVKVEIKEVCAHYNL